MRFLAALSVLLIVGVACSDEPDASTSETVDLDARDNDELDALQKELRSAQDRIAELQSEIDQLEGLLAMAAADAADAALTANLELKDAEDALADATAELDDAQSIAAELMLSYSDEIRAARTQITQALLQFACQSGTERAASGTTSESLTTNAIVGAFQQSAGFQELATTPGVESAIRISEVLDEPFYSESVSEIRAAAVSCWQREDARVNQAFYVHEAVLRKAALEAACTLGEPEVFGRFTQGFEDTATYANWLLNLGFSDADEYLDSVEERFGSFESFLAIPTEELAAESERCADRRPMISPKSPGTWNVGDEIQVGTWNAYDESDCYWARLAENGDIRDNHFGDALRLSVKVQSSDGQFEISGCTFYFANP